MRTVKRMMCVMMAVILCCPGLTALASEQENIKMFSENPDLDIVIGEGMETPSCTAGEPAFKVVVPVKNNTDGSIEISDFKLEPVVGQEPNNFPFVLQSVHNEVLITEKDEIFESGTEAKA